MKQIVLPFDYLSPQPTSFDSVLSELVEGIAASHAQFAEMFGGRYSLPAIKGYSPDEETGFEGAERWLECMGALSLHDQQKAIEGMPIATYVTAFWDYAMNAHWPRSLAHETRCVFHHVATFCDLLRFTAELRSFGSILVPINIERLYVRARPRLLIDIAREPNCVEESDLLVDGLSIDDVAILAGIKPQSVRNAVNAKGDARLASRRYQGELWFEPLDAHRWLLGRKRYVPTDLSGMAPVDDSRDGAQA